LSPRPHNIPCPAVQRRCAPPNNECCAPGPTVGRPSMGRGAGTLSGFSWCRTRNNWDLNWFNEEMLGSLP
jgi:hypothetical protein